jgi:hypothetical protein
MSVSFDRVLSASFETLSPSARNILLHLASTPQAAEKDRQGIAELTDLDDEGGFRLGESLREIGTVLEDLLGMSPDTPCQPALVANHEDGFAGISDPSLPPEHVSGLLHSSSVDLTDDMTLPEQDDLDLHAIGHTMLPFDVHEAHSHTSNGWHALSDHRVPPTGDSVPSLSDDILGTSPMTDNYFLRFAPDALAESDLLAAEMLPKPAPNDSDSAYHSSPSSPGSNKPGGARKQPAAKGSFAPEDSKRRKSSPKATQPLRISPTATSPRHVSLSDECSIPFEANCEVKASGQYRGMSQRDAHNAMERERRIQLRENFECLRSEVPALRDADKAATLQILREATTYIQRMRDEEKRLVEEKAQLLALNETLRQNATLLHDDGDSDVPPLLAPPSC